MEMLDNLRPSTIDRHTVAFLRQFMLKNHLLNHYKEFFKKHWALNGKKISYVFFGDNKQMNWSDRMDIWEYHHILIFIEKVFSNLLCGNLTKNAITHRSSPTL